MAKDKYIPGVCNIGPQEIKRRAKDGWVALIATLVIWALFTWLGTPRIWRLTLFFPAAMAAIGFLQAKMHFCVAFALGNLFNFGEIGKTDTVTQAEDRAQDRKKAWTMISFAVLAGLLLAYLGYAT